MRTHENQERTAITPICPPFSPRTPCILYLNNTHWLAMTRFWVLLATLPTQQAHILPHYPSTVLFHETAQKEVSCLSVWLLAGCWLLHSVSCCCAPQPINIGAGRMIERWRWQGGGGVYYTALHCRHLLHLILFKEIRFAGIIPTLASS